MSAGSGQALLQAVIDEPRTGEDAAAGPSPLVSRPRDLRLQLCAVHVDRRPRRGRDLEEELAELLAQDAAKDVAR